MTKVIDLNSIYSLPKLPSIYLPGVDLKKLIDTGASNSVINSKPAYQKCRDYPYKNPFSITGLGNTLYKEDNLNIPLLSVFKIEHIFIYSFRTFQGQCHI